MERYEKYKPSGIEWIGEIPEHWEVKKIKHRCYVKGRVGWNGLKSSEFLTDGYSYLITGTDFKKDVIDWKNCYHIDEERYLEDPFIQLKNEDLLITKDGTIGKLAVVTNLEKPACLNSGIFVVRSLNPDLTTRYLFWVLKSRTFIQYNDLTAYGSTIQHLYQNVFVEFAFAFPLIQEQFSIATYLDRKTAEIDLIIANKQKLITLYEEEKQAVINLAVTRGVETHGMRLKSSGVEWLGDIPKHWEVKKLKYVARVQTGRTPMIQGAKCDYFENGEINWFTAADFNEDGNLNNSNRKITGEALKNNEVEVFPENSIYLVSIGATLGKVGIAKGKGCANQQINIIMFDNYKVLPKYGYYIFKASKETLINEADHTTLPILNQSKTKNLLLFIPSIFEQQTIVDYIEQECSRLDNINEKCKKQIELLKEYRTTLISEVVTGKVKVSN